MKSLPLSLRALIAIVLMIGFYALVAGFTGALLLLAWFDWTSPRGGGLIAVFAVALAAIILWSLVPRRIRFTPAGARLDPASQPELFAVIEEVARATMQQPPDEVYLTHDVTAGVQHTGGVLGIRSRRVMEIGLPLMQSISIAQFRAVIGHEFGHFHGGDTKLLPLVCRTRAAIARTVEALEDEDGVIHKPFEWYGRFYLRATQAISRSQELAADRLSVRVAGAENAAGALVAVRGAAAAHHAYWSTEVEPLLAGGYRPPLATGFDHFLAATIPDPSALDEPEKSPFDSHPTLAERLAAIGHSRKNEPTTEPRAVSLLRDVATLEPELFDGASKFITWEDVGTRIHLPSWRGRAQKYASILREVKAADLPALSQRLPDFAFRLRLSAEDGEQTEAAATILAGALAARLHDAGWMFDWSPGKPVGLTSGPARIEPFTAMRQLRARQLGAETWREQCRNAEIDEMNLIS